jgi:Mg2+-importing ATPase
MAVEGPISSIFDYATFFTMALVFSVPITAAAGVALTTQRLTHLQSQFQTAWFIESLCTQTLVVFIIRTRQTPFWKSKPGKYLVLSSFSVVAAVPFSTLFLPHPCFTLSLRYLSLHICFWLKLQRGGSTGGMRTGLNKFWFLNAKPCT